MSKRKQEAESAQKKKVVQVEEEEGMGEFEDRIDDDEFDSEEEIIYNNDEDSSGSDIDDDFELDELEGKMEDLKVFLPGQQMEKDEVLVADQSAYDMLHSLNVEWPCLSFDILSDKLGANRTTFPMTSYLVAGSQAENYNDNKVYVMKMSSLQKTKNDGDEDQSDDENEGDDPILEFKTINHEGGAMIHPELHVVATMAETGKVHIFDVTQHVNAFDTPGLIPSRDTKPIHTITKHQTCEGYGIDWSPIESGQLLTGDGRGRILLTKKTQSGFISDNTFFSGHTSSIEDIQWSPSQGNVFASCSADKTIKIWDARTKNKPQLSIIAHNTDVNVISWNKTVDYLLASGSDSGEFSVWDLRTWTDKKQTPETAAKFNWHQGPITSIEWHPFESSVLAVSGADDQLTLWDLALERDEEEEIIMGTNSLGQEIQVPPQLLFIHQGQKNIKELHWHAQIPGMIVSTAFDGFNVFKTFNA